tara:strand:+ start:1476 stop:1664 length:189 start_codon:yes stop_codon:yes gene_type:complete
MNIEPKNTPIYKYRLYDFSRPEGKELTDGIHLLTAREANIKNRAFATNHAQKKYIKINKYAS